MNRTDDSAFLESAWRTAEAALPPGWELDGLRCQSGGLSTELRSDRWRAVARGPGGATLAGEGQTALEALEDLTRKLRRAEEPAPLEG